MAEENRKNIDELKTSADSLLARLNSQLDAEPAKPEGAEEKPARSAATGGLTDEKYSELYEKYLGGKPSETGLGGGDYESLHGRIVDLQKESGGETPKVPDVDESIKQAETFGAELPDDTVGTGKSSEEDDEYWDMMKTACVTHVKKEETPAAEEAPGEDTVEASALQKNIEDAENYVETCAKESTPEPEPVKNVDNYSTNPSLGRAKKSPFAALRRDKAENTGEYKSGVRAHSDDAEGEKTVTFNRFSKSEKSVADDKLHDTEAKKTESHPSDDTKNLSDTAMMMMAFGYEPEKKDGKNQAEAHNFDEYSFSDTEELSNAADMGDTSMYETENTKMKGAVTEMMDKPSIEYIKADNDREIFEEFKKRYNSLRLRMIICAVLAFGLLVWEFILPVAGVAIDTPVLIMVDWVMTLVCAVLVCDRLIYAAKRIAKLGFDADSFTLVMFFLSLITSVVALFAADAFEVVRLYNFTFAICALFSLLSAFLLLNRNVYAFKIISSEKTKRVFARMSKADCPRENIAFGEFLNEESEVCKAEKTEFISNFFSGTEEEPQSRKPLKILVPAVFGLSLIVFLISVIAIKDCDFYQSMTNAYVTFLMTAPLSVFLSFAYSSYRGSARAYSHGAAILSEATPEKYGNTAVITFTDEDAFPADRIKLKSVKVMENNNIESVIYFASSVFSKIGGPLAAVFRAASLDTASSDNVEIKELSYHGIDAVVDGRHIVVGQPEYMENQCFETVKESSDEECVGKTNRRILYLACDETIIAKFYIQYNTSPDFIYIVKHLYESGICVAISTIDPCIDNDILYKNRLDPERYAIKIIKGSEPEGTLERISSFDCGIASTGSLKGMVKTLMLCDRLSNLVKTNLAMKIVSAVLGAIIIGLVIGAGAMSSFTSVIPALYQLFWMIPMYLVSKVYIR